MKVLATSSFAAGQLEPGREAFNRGAFFEAHELWEKVWRAETGPIRIPIQGLIQIAAGCHHLQNGRPGPGARLLQKGREKFGTLDLGLEIRD